jgi:hypothetical protein
VKPAICRTHKRSAGAGENHLLSPDRPCLLVIMPVFVSGFGLMKEYPLEYSTHPGTSQLIKIVSAIFRLIVLITIPGTFAFCYTRMDTC